MAKSTKNRRRAGKTVYLLGQGISVPFFLCRLPVHTVFIRVDMR